MKAMVLDHTGPVEGRQLHLRALPPPVPGEHEVSVSVHACGLCHTDLHIIEGDLQLPRLPLVPGHQIVGHVDRIGSGVTKWKAGERVGIPWLNHTCGQCRFCTSGRENLCTQIRFTGFHADGGYAEAVVVHEDYLYRLPREFSDREAAPLLCAGVIGYRALRLAGVHAGIRLGLYGFGASAHIAIQIARYLGAEVSVFSRSKEHRQLGTELGATWTGSADEKPPHPLDASVIFAPAGKLVPIALHHLDRGGTLTLAGIHMSPIPEMPYALLYEERIVRSVANSTRKDVEEMLSIAGKAAVKVAVEDFPLSGLNEALWKLKRSEINGSGVAQIGGA